MIKVEYKGKELSFYDANTFEIWLEHRDSSDLIELDCKFSVIERLEGNESTLRNIKIYSNGRKYREYDWRINDLWTIDEILTDLDIPEVPEDKLYLFIKE